MKQRYQGDDIPCILNQGKSTLSLAGLKKNNKKSKTVMFSLRFRAQCSDSVPIHA